MKRTRKPKLLMVLLLTGGAIINVVVAWGFGLWSVADEPNETLLDQTTVANCRRENGMPAIEATAGYEVRGNGVTLHVIYDSMSYQNSTISFGHTLVDGAFGWPARSLGCGMISTDGEIKYVRAIGVSNPYSTSVLPYGPIWPGFAINTIFYAAILWLLFAAPGLVRRRIRARRGQCPACAYPVGSSTVCTECGRPLR